MKRNRRIHSANFKSKVAIETLKEQKTMSQLSEQYTLHANQISDWKKTLVEGSASLFEKREKNNSFDMDAFQAPFLEQIGSLQIELQFLKKMNTNGGINPSKTKRRVIFFAILA